MDLAPLFARIEQLAPQFGRAEDDLKVLVVRGRGGDFKGAMQNARLVLEALLRHLVTAELKQTPGKAMVDELLSKFRQAQNAHLIPTPVLAHMGTVQAWGNLSSHDHAASLSDANMKLGPEEVATALNSLVAVLAWYAEKYGAPQAAAAPALPLPATAPRKKPTNPAVKVLAVGLALAAGGYAAWVVATQGPSAVESANALAMLNQFYLANKEPPPSSGRCRVTDTRTLVSVAKAPGALATLQAAQKKSPEIWYLIARAQVEAGQSPDEALAHALECEGFAAAHGLKAKLLGKADRKDEAAAELQKALDTDPDWARAHYNLGLVELSRGGLDAGLAHLSTYLTEEPGDGDGWMVLGAGYEGAARLDVARGQSPDANQALAREAYCAAVERGKAEAKDRCQPR